MFTVVRQECFVEYDRAIRRYDCLHASSGVLNLGTIYRCIQTVRRIHLVYPLLLILHQSRLEALCCSGFVNSCEHGNFGNQGDRRRFPVQPKPIFGDIIVVYGHRLGRLLTLGLTLQQGWQTSALSMQSPIKYIASTHEVRSSLWITAVTIELIYVHAPTLHAGNCRPPWATILTRSILPVRSAWAVSQTVDESSLMYSLRFADYGGELCHRYCILLGYLLVSTPW